MTPAEQSDFLEALQTVYGPFESLSLPAAESWNPPALAEGHLGRYLWTDAFGVLNFLTLHKSLSSPIYLTLASRLITTVHSILGRTRDQTSLLPHATPEHPLSGGLRIGKEDEHGPDGDGQYHHYLTMWMFALNRFSVAAQDGGRHNTLAMEMARAIHPAFMTDRDSERPRMHWKMTMDLRSTLVTTEGGLDPFDGYVVFSLLHESRQKGEPGLEKEIAEYKRIVESKYGPYNSEDPLDLGMMLWACHWKSDEEWSNVLKEGAVTALKNLDEDHELDLGIGHRLAFREFGSIMGIKCYDLRNQDYWKFWIQKVMNTWRKAGQVPTPTGEMVTLPKLQKLAPITLVMFCAAVEPGVFRKGFLYSR